MINKIFGIDKIEELDSIVEPLNIRILLKYPNYKDLLKFKPSVRIKIIRQRKRDIFKEFLSTIDRTYKRVGSHIDPSGLEIECTKKELLKFNKDKRIESISIKGINEKYETEFESNELWFVFITRFAIQIENKIKGIQDYEDRILMIKAKNQKEAEKKLKKGFKRYEEPYLNIYGELVRWKFEEFIDVDVIDYNFIEDLKNNGNEGIEILSRIKSRRLNKEKAWIIEYEDNDEL